MIRLLTILFCFGALSTYAQRVPNEAENIDYLMTFGKQASSADGDDDHVQIFFFTIPKNNDKPFYLRIYDPDTGDKHDDPNGAFNTKTKFSIYGGSGAFTNEDARRVNPEGNYKSGNLMAAKVFGKESTYNARWYTFGPFNPMEGEYAENVGGYVFKVVAEGVVGDDGNAYRYFLSSESERNLAVEGANAFAYEYTFKMPERQTLSHIYPFVDKSVISITQHNFDFDNDGKVMIYSVAKNRHVALVSGDDEWALSKHIMREEEKNTTVDLQILKTGSSSNTMSIYITNQYNQPIPFFAIPIGGPPKYKYSLSLKYR